MSVSVWCLHRRVCSGKGTKTAEQGHLCTQIGSAESAFWRAPNYAPHCTVGSLMQVPTHMGTWRAARSPRGVPRSMGSGPQAHPVWPGQPFPNFAVSSRSPEVHGLWPPGPFCVARAAFSELRGVLAESGVLRRGVRVSNLPGLCKVFVSFPSPTRD